MNRATRTALPFLFLAALACDSTAATQYAPPAPRQQAPPPGVSEAPPDQEIRQTVARVSLISGNVSFSRGDDPDTWSPVDLNVPMALGDRVWTGDDGQLELQVHGGSLVRLAARTDLQALNLTTDVKQFSLALGTASFSVRRLDDNDVFEVDTPNAAITFERPGDYRVDVNQNGDSRVQVRRGRAIASAGGGEVTMAAGQQLDLDGIDAPRYEVVALAPTDGWDRWVEARDQRLAQTRSYTYVTADIAGVEDLDQYGRWQQIPNDGWAWTPTSVDVGWTPYRTGRWMWQDPWGWTWVAAEPWGWAPYHYGRWAFYGTGWYWVPVGPAVRAVAYSPALVAFVGGSGGYVGWFPLAPRDPYYPWWRRGPSVHVEPVTYVNRTYVTVVNQTAFVSGRSVSRDVVRDRAVIHSVESAPVLRGPVPVVPTRASIRMTTREGSAARPPATTASRQVVTRAAPPPPPPSFDTKLAVIREKGGAPVAGADAARLGSADARAAQRSRPAPDASGPVTLEPKNGAARPSPGRPQPTAPAARPSSSSTRPTAVKQAPDRPTPRRPTPPPAAPPQPERAPAERVQAPPPMKERAQPAERIAPEPHKHSSPARPTPKRTPTKTPK